MVRRLSLALFVLFAASTAAFAQTAGPPPEPQITTQGDAVLKLAPDQAWVSMTVEARDGKAAEARKQAAALMTTVQTALKAAGIPADAIKTVSFSLQPQMEWQANRARVKDYLARNEINVRVDNLDLIGDVLDSAGSLKTPASSSIAIGGLRFDVKDRESAERNVLGMAVKDALRRAQAIAAGAGRSPGSIIRIEDQRMDSTRPEPIFMARGAVAMSADAGRGGAAAIDTPITPGEIEFRGRVTLTIAIM